MARKSSPQSAVVVEHRKTLKTDTETEGIKEVKPASIPRGKMNLTPLTNLKATEPKIEKHETDEPETDVAANATSKPSELNDKQIAAHQAHIQELITNETFFLPINQVEKRRNKRYVVAGAVCIVILGLAWADVALDSGILTIPGVKAPTHFFK